MQKSPKNKVNKRKRKETGSWVLYWTFRGRRYSKSVGPNEQIAEQKRSKLEARLLPEDAATISTGSAVPLFKAYASEWMRQYAEVECKPSTIAGYASIIQTRLMRPFGELRLNEITRAEIREHIFTLMRSGLSRNTIQTQFVL